MKFSGYCWHLAILWLLAGRLVTASPAELVVTTDAKRRVQLREQDKVLLTSPPEGLWSIATGWEDDWPSGWLHAHPEKAERFGPWIVLSGALAVKEGIWALQDSYRREGSHFKVVRRFTWRGNQPARMTTLSIRWQVPRPGVSALLPGNLYYGNPSGVRSGRGLVPSFAGNEGEAAIFEEHRYPMPFASLEWQQGKAWYGAALHSLPSRTPFGNVPDQWWSLGVQSKAKASELILMSGPCTMNGVHSVVKAGQHYTLPYPDTWINVPPGGVIEKTFYLEATRVSGEGSGFRPAVRTSLQIFKPYCYWDLPSFEEILEPKLTLARSRWLEFDRGAGFKMYPDRGEIVMGWCGQAAAPGYALPVLSERLRFPQGNEMAQRSLDFLAGAPVDETGFPVRYNSQSGEWYRPDPVSQGQAMENIARAVMYGRKRPELDTRRWETFLQRACDSHARRILSTKWHPLSTNEGFLISPLAKAAKLFGKSEYRRAAIKAAEHYATRHLTMREPYWGGTLDASCEDKEAAWAAFQGFLAVYDLTGEKKYLQWADHACDVMLTYTVVWDIDMPPGRLRDHGFKTRGWTAVSVQNQHLDVYGVLTAPNLYRMGALTGRQELRPLAILMYRTCGQLIDARGSQGEQIQQTNYAQGYEVKDVYQPRGGYNETWTVFWITAHFLNAAAQFEEMGAPVW